MKKQPLHIFALFGADDPDKLDEAVERAFTGRSYQIESGQWLVRSDTSQPAEVYKALFDENDPIICLVVMLAGYYGLHDKATWDWIEANQYGE